MGRERKNICGVYKITCKENGLIYIGSSKNIEQRWKEHKRDLDKQRHVNMFLQEDWDEYGEDVFIFEVIEETDLSSRYKVEQKYLDELKPYYRNGRGYNICENVGSQNSTGIRIFKRRFRRLNPFYKATKSQIKKMLKKEGFYGDYEYRDYFDKEIDTESRHEWFEVPFGSCYVEYRGLYGKHCVRQLDADMVDNMSRDELEDYVSALDTYDDIANYMREFGDPDDWE